VRIRIRSEQASVLQMNDWLAELRDGEGAEVTDPGQAGPIGPGYAVPAGYGHAVPTGPGRAEPASYVRAAPAGPGYAVPAGHGGARPTDGTARPAALARPFAPAAAGAPARTAPAVPARSAAAAAPAGPAKATARAVIGDQLRMPIMWCEMGSCISWHADPEALGEADTRARAIGAGWRIDAFGRLACPRCQHTDPGYRAARQVMPWDRYTAVARTGRPREPQGSSRRPASPRPWPFPADLSQSRSGPPEVGEVAGTAARDPASL